MERLWVAVAATVAVAAVFTVAALGARRGATPLAAPSDGPLSVVATTGMVAEVVREVGGAEVAVSALMGPGIDPHLYKATEGDVARLLAADAVFYTGLHFEGKLVDVFHKIAARGGTRPFVAVAGALPRDRLLAADDAEGAVDPHLWFDVPLWAETTRTVEAALTALRPAAANTFAAGGARYRERLHALDAELRTTLAAVPAPARVLITAHDAFGYLGRAYGMEVRGVQGISTSAEAGSRELRELAQFIAERRIPAIFVESSVSPRTVTALQAAVRARGFDVVIGGELYSDALGPGGSGADTYEGMMRHNITTLARALSRPDGSAQPTGDPAP